PRILGAAVERWRAARVRLCLRAGHPSPPSAGAGRERLASQRPLECATRQQARHTMTCRVRCSGQWNATIAFALALAIAGCGRREATPMAAPGAAREVSTIASP